MKSAFLLPYIGPLPPFLAFWAKSCETNAYHFHWYVYSDHAATIRQINSAVTIIPYQFEEMLHDFKSILGIEINHPTLRMLCNYRLLFYFLRRDREPLDQYRFIGYTDMDMIYGDLFRFLPPQMERYALISADPGHPCGPFTMMRRDRVMALQHCAAVRQAMNLAHYRAFDESKEFLDILSEGGPSWCQPDGLQPAITRKFNRHRIFSIWDHGRLTIYDNLGHRQEGGFHHFSRYKDRKTFRVQADPQQHSRWGTYKNGIIPISGRGTFLRMLYSMMV